MSKLFHSPVLDNIPVADPRFARPGPVPSQQRYSTRYAAAMPGIRLLTGIWLALATPALWAACSVSATGVSFGNYDIFATQPLDSTGNANVSCDVSTSYSVSLSTGSGTYTSRTMTNGAHVLNYNLYSNSSRTTVWGDGSGGTVTVDNTGTLADHTVYGRIPAQQNAYVGSYSDTVIVTVTF